MKKVELIVVLIVVFCLNAVSQEIFPIDYRVEKQSMSTPMSPVEDIFFNSSYYTKPVNVKFDGKLLHMYYDNGGTFVKKNLSKVTQDAEYEDNSLIMETFYFVDDSNVSDTLLFVVDYDVAYLQMILPTRNSKGEKIGYTSYRKFVKGEELASYRKSKEEELALN